MMAIISKAVFETEARDFDAVLGVGEVFQTNVYNSRHRSLDALAEDDGDLYLVTVRPDDVLWLVAVLKKPNAEAECWRAKQPSKVPITDITSLVPKLKFSTGKGIKAKKGRLGMSLQTPRKLSDADVELLQGALGRKPAADPADPDSPLTSVLADFDSDEARLVYADWLMQRGDPLGEFVVAQIELAGGSMTGRRRRQLKKKTQQLMTANYDAWTRVAKDVAEGWVFRRGLIDEVTLTAESFVERAATLFASHPIRKVAITDINGDAEDRVPASENLGRVRKLSLRGDGVGRTLCEALASSPHTASLQELHFGTHTIDAACTGALAAAEHFQPHMLALTANPLGNKGVKALLTTDFLDSCRKLYLSNTGIDDVGLRALIESDHTGALELLCVSNNEITDEGSLVLLQHPTLKRVEIQSYLSWDATKKLRERYGSRIKTY